MTYAADGQPQSLTLPDGITENYAYDPAGQLSGITYDGEGGTQIGDLNYSYDPAGRLTAQWGTYARTSLPSAITSAVYDAADELISTGAASYTYDPDGNLTSDDGNTYTWNTRGQLTQLSTPTQTATFTYDAFGRRATKTVGGTTTGYLYDGSNVLEELNATTPTAELLTGLGTDQTLARTTTLGTDSYLTDRLGSTVALTDQNGTTTTGYTYDPFGQSSSDGAASTNPYQYTGRENDGLGLQYNRARYYNPATAAFVSRDPLESQTHQPYQYAGADPLSFTDPSGESFEDCKRLLAIAGVAWCLGGEVIDTVTGEGQPHTPEITVVEPVKPAPDPPGREPDAGGPSGPSGGGDPNGPSGGSGPSGEGGPTGGDGGVGEGSGTENNPGWPPPSLGSGGGQDSGGGITPGWPPPPTSGAGSKDSFQDPYSGITA